MIQLGVDIVKVFDLMIFQQVAKTCFVNHHPRSSGIKKNLNQLMPEIKKPATTVNFKTLSPYRTTGGS